MSRSYRVVIEHDPENGTYWAHVPALPGCFTQGDTVQETIEHLREPMALFLDGLREAGEPIPDGDGEPEEPIHLSLSVPA